MAEVNSNLCWYCEKAVDTKGIGCLKCMNARCDQQMHGQCLIDKQDPEGLGKVLKCPKCSENNIAFCIKPDDDINEDAKKPMGSAGGRRKYKKHKKTKKHRKHRKYGKTKRR